MSDATPVAGRYRLDELIGSGSMGEVWRGYDTRADWVVAVKVLGAEAVKAATRESLRQHVQAVARVIHPNVAMVLDVGERDGAPFLVMEYLTGLSLGEELAAGGPMGIVDVCDLIGQAAAGLDAAHRAGVVHGEIDPDSFRRAGSGVLKVVGFGLGDQGSPAGSRRYAAPEGAGQASADLYALGCVCYELLCGRPPFEGEGADEMGAPVSPDSAPGISAGPRASREAPVPPSAHRAEVPAELDRLVLAMIALDPAQRPVSGEAVRRALAAIARPHAGPGAVPLTGANPATVPATGANPAIVPATGATTAPGAVPVTGALLREGGLVGGAGPAARPGAAVPQGATEIYPAGGPGGGARAGDTAIYQAGDVEPEPSSNRKLFLQLGAAVAVIAAVTVGMVMWAGARKEPPVTPTPTAATLSTLPPETPAASPTETPEPTEAPTGNPSPGGVVDTILPDDPPASLRETAPAKATLGPQAPPRGWGEWLGRFDEAVGYQLRDGGISPEAAAKARDKIRKAARKLEQGKTGATVDQVADVYRELRQAQERGDMDRSGPLVQFMNDWRIQAG